MSFRPMAYGRANPRRAADARAPGINYAQGNDSSLPHSRSYGQRLGTLDLTLRARSI